MALHRSSSGRVGEPGPKIPRSRASPSLMSWPLFSTRPSVYSTNRLPSSTWNRRLSTSPSPMPSGGEGGTSSSSLVPSGCTSSGGRWPATATSHSPLTAS